MSYFLQIGATGGPTQVASNAGYADFGRWVESLHATAKYPQLVNLYTFGWCQELPDLEEQLADAIEDEKPDADVASIGQEILDLLKHRDQSATVCTITSGIGE